MDAARLDPDGGEWPSVPGALEAGDTGPDGGHAIRRPEIPGHGDARPGEHEGPDDSGAGCFEGTRPGRTEGPGHPGAREHERAEGHGDPGARSCQGHGDPGARSCQGHGDPGARVCQGNGDPGARVCQGNGDPGARVCQGNGDPGARVCQGNGDPGARVRQGHGDPGTRVRQGHGDPGARVRQGHGDPGARVRQGHGDPGARVCQGHGDPGARVCQGHGDPGARVCQGHGDPGARVCQGHGDPGARVCQGHGDPGARVCQGHGDPGARVCQGHGDPRSGEGPGDRVDEGPRDQYAGSHEGPRIPSPRSHEGPRCPSPRSHEGPRCPSPRSNEESGDSGTGIDESPRWPSEKPELPRDRTNENTNAPRDRSAEQRVFGSGGTERTHAPGTCGERRAGVHGQEGLDVPGTSRPTKCNDARTNAPAKQLRPELSKGDEPGTMDGPEDPRGAESFKKPVTPARTGWNEKTLEQRNPPPTPAQPPPSVSTGGAERETAKDLSARLPSDAYRASPAIPYREPPWAGLPEALYSLEVLKAGSILSNKSLTGFSWTVFGRLPGCHISLEHPSVSRHHAVLQYRSLHGTEPDEEPGFYVYDLGSTHGTFINKQRIQPKTYCRFRVGHVLKFGGSTRLFVLQGPDDDQDVESDLTVTQIKEARRQRENLQKRMLGDDSDDDDDDDDEEEEEELGEEEGRKEAGESGGNSGCMWGMGEDALDEENDENPIALEFQEEHEALYLKNPKKALQGFFDREGEELEFEYDEPGPGSWVCRVTLPVEDSSGKQLVAEITHSGKKKDSAKLCALEACRMLEMRGLLRQEAVSRKRKAKQWEDEDFYDSDDDTFLDRTGIVEKKRLNRMKKAGKIGEKPETYESLTSKLGLVEKEITEIASQLKTTQTGEAQNSAQDSLDAFMTEIKARCALDSVTRKKLHLQSLELKKEQQRLKRLIKIVQPTKLPELKPSPPEQDPNTKKRTLPMFGAMKGGCKFKLKTGTVGKLPARRMDLPASLFIMKDDNNEPEEDDDDMQVGAASNSHSDTTPTSSDITEQSTSSDPGRRVRHAQVAEEGEVKKVPEVSSTSDCVQAPNTHKPPATPCEEIPKAAAAKPRKMQGPSRPPQAVLSTIYPEDDPDYCVWTPPAGQTGDGKTHLNEKYGY